MTIQYYTIIEIAKVAELSQENVRHHVKRSGIEADATMGRAQGYSVETVRRILAYIASSPQKDGIDLADALATKKGN